MLSSLGWGLGARVYKRHVACGQYLPANPKAYIEEALHNGSNEQLGCTRDHEQVSSCMTNGLDIASDPLYLPTKS